MLEQDEITRIKEAIQSIEVVKIDGKFFNLEEISKFLSNHGYNQTDLDLIDSKADHFTESDYLSYLNREEGAVYILGYEYEAGTALKAIDEGDFDDSYEEYCNDNLHEFNFHGTPVFYTDKELKRVTGKVPLFGYSINRRLEGHKVTDTPNLPTQPTL